MTSERRYEVLGIEALRQHSVKNGEGGSPIAGEETVHKREAVLVVEHIEVAAHIAGLDVVSAESHGLVENRKRIPHRAVGLEGYDVQAFLIDPDAFLFCNVRKVGDYILDTDTVEVISLAAAHYGRQYLVLLGGGQDEDSVCRGLLKGFEEGVEGGLREHMDLIYDEDRVASGLGRNLHLVYQGLDVLDAVVRGGVELVDAV